MGREVRLKIAFELVGEAPPQYGVREVLARAGEEGLFYMFINICLKFVSKQRQF